MKGGTALIDSGGIIKKPGRKKILQENNKKLKAYCNVFQKILDYNN